MITATILFFVAGPVKMLAGQVKICTTGPTGPVEKILSVDPCIYVYILGLSRYQNFSIRYQYQWKSTVLGTNFGTKAKHKNMLIKKHIFINKVKTKINCTKTNAIFYAYLKLFQVFPQLIKVWKKVNKFHPKVCHISAAAEKHL